MAIVPVNKKQTGSAATASLAITAATAGNLLVAFITQTGSATALTLAGWTINPTRAQLGLSTQFVHVATKIAAGGEAEIKPTPAEGGVIQGISYWELSSGSEAVDVIVHNDNIASANTATSSALVRADAGDVILACFGATAASGAIEAWSSSDGGTPTQNEALTSRTWSSAYIPGTTTTLTITGKWTTAKVTGMLTVALKPAAAGGTVTIPLNAAAATSSASMALTSTNAVPLAPAAAVSAASLAMTVNTTVPLQAAAAASAASLAMTAQTRVPLSPAASVSAAALTVTTLMQIPLQAASATSAASCTVTRAGAVLTTIPLNPAAATSSASLSLGVAVTVPLNAASSTSSATCTVTLSLAPVEPVYASAGHSLLIYASAGARPLIYAKGAVSL